MSVSWTAEALASSDRDIDGNAGRYVSIDRGPIATMDPSSTMSRRCGMTASRTARMIAPATDR